MYMYSASVNYITSDQDLTGLIRTLYVFDVSQSDCVI